MNNSIYGDTVESSMTRKLLATSTWTIFSCVALFAIWAIFTDVDEIAKAPGSVIPEGDRQVIQSDTGGKIAQIYVREGQMVSEGDILVEFDATFENTALDELTAQQAALALTVERLSALIEERDPNFEDFQQRYPALVVQQRNQMASEQQTFESQKRSLVTQRAESEAELNGLKTSLPSLQAQLASTQQELDIMNEAATVGNVSRLQVLQQQEKLSSVDNQIKQAQSQQEVLERRLATIDAQIDQQWSEAVLNYNTQRSQAATDLAALGARVRSGEERVFETVIRSPLHGLVQTIPTTLNGAVIAPGGTIAEIVPIDGKAKFKARLSPRDIGFVSVGQHARVKVDAFDYSRFGALNGEVSLISPTTSQDERGQVYYEVEIEVEQTYFGNDPSSFVILPGMTGEVDIATGEKTVFQYLWKPIYTNVSRAFGER
ncbi:HlyD family type I secretion periplasmic adaptor subunit [Umboniibacter marinipuniceus]|uniref:Membrane fusion protein (MFP) family protein n=1 Tax=Umboniibacter marinipuniceus TaxID=569599 RepID=A0A3M0A1I0_9GAMM|nr:HlyD family type I secretion periplasmic adaptor subunit [Umboniibacter marinipuniceus]RMA78477.1 HlyD family secretion protein/adhesin transport system membrane fusion protein [Umboniibacter marinipuniceus]